MKVVQEVICLVIEDLLKELEISEPGDQTEFFAWVFQFVITYYK
jgi:hypothetical protein